MTQAAANTAVDAITNTFIHSLKTTGSFNLFGFGTFRTAYVPDLTDSQTVYWARVSFLASFASCFASRFSTKPSHLIFTFYKPIDPLNPSALTLTHFFRCSCHCTVLALPATVSTLKLVLSSPSLPPKPSPSSPLLNLRPMLLPSLSLPSVDPLRSRSPSLSPRSSKRRSPRLPSLRPPPRRPSNKLLLPSHT